MCTGTLFTPVYTTTRTLTLPRREHGEFDINLEVYLLVRGALVNSNRVLRPVPIARALSNHVGCFIPTHH